MNTWEIIVALVLVGVLVWVFWPKTPRPPGVHDLGKLSPRAGRDVFERQQDELLRPPGRR